MTLSPKTKEACEWFRSFYITSFMHESTLFPLEDYDPEVEKSKYQESYDQHLLDVEKEKERCRQSNIDFDPKWLDQARPREPLRTFTESFLKGPLDDVESPEKIDQFDDITLLNIICETKKDVDMQKVRTESRESLVERVSRIVEEEYETAELPIEYHSVTELMSGVFCMNNWRWLSHSDLCKWSIAHGLGSFIDSFPSGYCDMIHGILDNQIEMLQEMVSKDATGNGDESRGYDRPRAIFKDNKTSRGLPCTADDEPDIDERNRKKKKPSKKARLV